MAAPDRFIGDLKAYIDLPPNGHDPKDDQYKKGCRSAMSIKM